MLMDALVYPIGLKREHIRSISFFLSSAAGFALKRVAILQSNYIPWKGYFDLIRSVDEFIIYDDMQYTRRDWRNRNLIKTPNGLIWLTVPVRTKGKYDQRIDETEIEGDAWLKKHWASMKANYGKSRYFDDAAEVLEPLYESCAPLLSDQNVAMMTAVNGYLGIDTTVIRSTQFKGEGVKTDRLLSLCRATGADVYVSGPSAKAYFEMDKFDDAGIAVEWFDYGGYREYDQLWGEFEHGVSIVDVMFNCGPHSADALRRD